jgi:hypothetical protein
MQKQAFIYWGENASKIQIEKQIGIVKQVVYEENKKKYQSKQNGKIIGVWIYCPDYIDTNFGFDGKNFCTNNNPVLFKDIL